MDFDKLERRKSQNREQYRPKPMKADSENELVYVVIFIIGFIFLFGAYSFNREKFNDFFDGSKEQVEKVADFINNKDFNKEEQLRKERQRNEHVRQKNNQNNNQQYNDDYDRINFVNNSSGDRKIYWVDRRGNKNLYKTLKPKQSYEQKTRSHHKWLVTDSSGRSLGTYNSKGAKSYVNMYEENVEHVTEESGVKSTDPVEKINNNTVKVESVRTNARSVEAKTAASINFINSSNKLRKIYWLNYKGQKILYKKLKPRQSHSQRTFMTHPWLVTDENDNEIGVYYPELQRKDVKIER